MGAKGSLESEPLGLTDVESLPAGSQKATARAAPFALTYTTGPFSLPKGAGSLDWVVLNNDATAQKVRVTVFRCNLGAAKTALPPGPLIVPLAPGATTHNANTYPVGFVYEVQVECNSKLIFPYVASWPGSFGEIIAGSGINSANFIRTLF
jgi:hypothetical protein